MYFHFKLKKNFFFFLKINFNLFRFIIFICRSLYFGDIRNIVLNEGKHSTPPALLRGPALASIQIPDAPMHPVEEQQTLEEIKNTHFVNQE